MKIILKSKNSTIKKGGEKRMRYSKVIFAFSIGIFVIATMAFLGNIWAAEDVRNTKHNLAANTNIGASGSTEVCVFCHTPHGGATNVAGGAAPLWNRNMTTVMNNNYTMYTSPNFDNADTDTSDRKGKPKGVSLACLSCHDGTVAFDALLNFPGSGSADSIAFNGAFVDTDNSFKETDRSVGGPSPFPNLGTDLSNDHPISIEICKNPNPSGHYDPQFAEACNNSSVPTGNNKILKISRTGFFPGDIRDTVRAYQSGAGTTNWFVECASCHNPHEASRPGIADEGPYSD